MKRKMILIILLFCCVLFSSLFARDMDNKIISIDMGFGMSMAFVNNNLLSGSAFAILSSMRGVYFFDARYLLSDSMSTGLELGIAGMTAISEADTTLTPYLLVDIPIRGIFRLGNNAAFILLFAGIYMPLSPMVETLADIGARVSASNIYAEASYIIGTISYPKFAIGFILNDIAEF